MQNAIGQSMQTGRSPVLHLAMTLLDRLARFMADPLAVNPDNKTVRPHHDSTSINAVLVIDASPSMLETDWPPSRLEAAQKAALQYAQRLHMESPTAHVGVVAYGSRAWTVAKLTANHHSSRLADQIQDIPTDSGTNITAGLKQAESLLRRVTGRSQVVLLTDGGHNYGPKPNRIASRLRSVSTLETVGIGGSPADVDETLLNEIASARPDGSKRYRWIGDGEELIKHFECLAEGLVKA